MTFTAKIETPTGVLAATEHETAQEAWAHLRTVRQAAEDAVNYPMESERAYTYSDAMVALWDLSVNVHLWGDRRGSHLERLTGRDGTGAIEAEVPGREGQGAPGLRFSVRAVAPHPRHVAPAGYRMPALAVRFQEHAGACGWEHRYAWHEADAPFVKVGAMHPETGETFRATWHGRDQKPGRLRLFGRVLHQPSHGHAWVYASSLRAAMSKMGAS
ncbi:hypothetical protein [Pseudactinotalea sp.]|uniref:hypothetical protein n=1 Tax=Pseudactinotalea sp. TaxID=1926260 RepID=UPI003B3BE9A4